MSHPAIEVNQISKKYRYGTFGYTTLREAMGEWWMKFSGKKSFRSDEEFWALKEVSFSVPKGQVLGVIGRNGAGKSTLLKILSQITLPTKGSARVRGKVASLLEVGTGFQPELSGRENIYLNGAILGLKKKEIDKKFDEIVSFAELEKFVDTPVKHYSSGMYVRLAFSIAAYLEPDILLLDEVLAVGDSSFQKKCLGKMGDVAKLGRTVLFVSHNLASVATLCDRAIVLHEGALIKDASPKEAIDHYLSTIRGQATFVEWTDPTKAPGDDLVRLGSVKIFQDNLLQPVSDVDISKETLVEIGYWNFKSDALLFCSIWLRDQMGNIVLSSGCHHSVSLTKDDWYNKPRPVGFYKTICRIPANFLNQGFYSIAAIVGKNIHETIVLQDYAVTFEVHDSGEMRKEFLGQWWGSVRPKLAWSTEYMGNPNLKAGTS